MNRFQLVPLIFGVLSGVFLFLAFLDYRRTDSLINPRRKTWLRVGIIFGCVTAVLLILERRM